MAPLLSLTEVTKHRAEGRRAVVVLNKVSLTIEHGDFVGIWGPKRSGKSTLLRIAAGIEQPDSGDVYFDGQSVPAMSARARARLLRDHGIALVSTDWHAHIVRPVVDLVATACASDGTPMREARLRARNTLRRLGAAECADLSTDRITLGERLRVGLAIALVREPRLLLVDEPSVLPSPLESYDLYELLRSLGRDRKLAVVVASENPDSLEGTLRSMAMSSGEVRSMDQTGVVVPLYSSNASPPASDALS